MFKTFYVNPVFDVIDRLELHLDVANDHKEPRPVLYLLVPLDEHGEGRLLHAVGGDQCPAGVLLVIGVGHIVVGPHGLLGHGAPVDVLVVIQVASSLSGHRWDRGGQHRKR